MHRFATPSTVDVSEVRRWEESITTPEITPPGVPLHAADAAGVRDVALYEGVLLPWHYGEREPVSQGPPIICMACGHRWGSLMSQPAVGRTRSVQTRQHQLSEDMVKYGTA
jgi:hypothetical protein